MVILGLIGDGKNPGAALVRDGELIAVVEEERITRYKSSHGFFPARSVATSADDVHHRSFLAERGAVIVIGSGGQDPGGLLIRFRIRGASGALFAD